MTDDDDTTLRFDGDTLAGTLVFNADTAIKQGVPVVTIGRSDEPGYVRWTGNDGEYYDMPVEDIPDVLRAIAKIALDCVGDPDP